ncbi:zinc ABC transporter substrate-binding protein [Pseudovibrio japonicus]|uniref:High-affinity zinc uptake system protein ZnuA n=1 Tax=Pseudovibrio japonicus TaxID=366534 RepID=A0ABQ3DX12_9HYPH|nr:zinc ABC transporter substrate-binding protein [Pseudovibrio japonicus]GHB19049.1 zinc ABC transporter substrate-binding protein [Pseudovibrio japonicus]
MRHLLSSISILSILAGSVTFPALAQAQINVVASIKPVHSLVASVMEGVGTPDLVVEGVGSPHSYSLRPSTARKIANADVVFWVGPQMESFLQNPLENLADDATIATLSEADGLTLLSFREGGEFEGHEHDDHAGETASEHAEHADEAHDDHDEADNHDEHDDHAAHEDHGEEAVDMHIWLDPQNAIAMLNEIERTLSEADPENAAQYAANAKAEADEINAASEILKAELQNQQNKPFVVFHDAYRYFEEAYDLNAVGSVTVSPEVLPGARRISEVREKLEHLGVACVFSEAQFNPRMVEVLKEGTNVNSAELDPLGSTLDDGPQLYTNLLKQMGGAFSACLSGNS